MLCKHSRGQREEPENTLHRQIYSRDARWQQQQQLQILTQSLKTTVKHKWKKRERRRPTCEKQCVQPDSSKNQRESHFEQWSPESPKCLFLRFTKKEKRKRKESQEIVAGVVFTEVQRNKLCKLTDWLTAETLEALSPQWACYWIKSILCRSLSSLTSLVCVCVWEDCHLENQELDYWGEDPRVFLPPFPSWVALYIEYIYKKLCCLCLWWMKKTFLNIKNWKQIVLPLAYLWTRLWRPSWRLG